MQKTRKSLQTTKAHETQKERRKSEERNNPRPSGNETSLTSSVAKHHREKEESVSRKSQKDFARHTGTVVEKEERKADAKHGGRNTTKKKRSLSNLLRDTKRLLEHRERINKRAPSNFEGRLSHVAATAQRNGTTGSSSQFKNLGTQKFLSIKNTSRNQNVDCRNSSSWHSSNDIWTNKSDNKSIIGHRNNNNNSWSDAQKENTKKRSRNQNRNGSKSSDNSNRNASKSDNSDNGESGNADKICSYLERKRKWLENKVKADYKIQKRHNSLAAKKNRYARIRFFELKKVNIRIRRLEKNVALLEGDSHPRDAKHFENERNGTAEWCNSNREDSEGGMDDIGDEIEEENPQRCGITESMVYKTQERRRAEPQGTGEEGATDAEARRIEEERKSIRAELKRLNDMLIYIKNFPEDRPYIAMFAKGAAAPEKQKLRDEILFAIKKRLLVTKAAEKGEDFVPSSQQNAKKGVFKKTETLNHHCLRETATCFGTTDLAADDFFVVSP